MSSTSGRGKSLVIFGCGYVGTAVARQALAQGWKVAALTRNAEKARKLRDLGLDPVVVADLDSEDWYDVLPSRFDAVLNCVSSAGGGVDGFRKSYLDGQRSILKWAKNGRIGCFIYTSSSTVYPQTNGEVVTEESPAIPFSETSKILLESETELLSSDDSIGHRFILRLSGIYGPGRHYILDKLRNGDTVFPGSGEHRLNLCHRNDIAEAIMKLLTSEIPGGIYNLSDSHPERKEDVVNWIAERIGAEKPSFDPTQETARMARRKTKSGSFPDRQVISTKLEQTLGWKPRYPTFREGYEAIFKEEEENAQG